MGIYYARVPGLVLAGPRNTDGAIAFNIFTCCGLPFLPTPPANLGIFADTASFAPFNPGVRVFAADFQNPRTLQWGASVEREVAKDLSLQRRVQLREHGPPDPLRQPQRAELHRATSRPTAGGYLTARSRSPSRMGQA